MNFWQLSHSANHKAIIDATTNKVITYGELKKLSENFEKELSGFNYKTLGIILCQNNLGALVAYLAALKTNHAVFLLDADLDSALLHRIIEIYQPNWIFAPAIHQKELAQYKSHAEYLDYRFYVATKSCNMLIHSDLGLLLSTSGSTGNPKVVRLSYRNLAENAASIASYLNLSSCERPITTLPLHYSYGLSVINSHLWAGATILLTPHSISTRDFWNFAQQHEVTSLAGVPYTYQMFQQLRFENISLPHLKTLTQAGGKLHSNRVMHFQKLAQEKQWLFYVMYGQTEATARISYLPPEVLANKLGAIGISIPNGQLNVDPETQELIYQGPNVMMGYAENREDLSKGDECHGLLKTGDLGHQDSDGIFYVTGRTKRFLKLFGLRINLEDVEQLVEGTHEIPVAATGDDQKLHVFIEQAKYLVSVKDLITSRYKLHPSAVKIHHIENMPRGVRGKPDYLKLQVMLTE